MNTDSYWNEGSSSSSSGAVLPTILSLIAIAVLGVGIFWKFIVFGDMEIRKDLSVSGDITSNRLITPGPGTNNANVKIAPSAGESLTTGNSNICIGLSAGAAITTGETNVCVGDTAAFSLTTTSHNVAIGKGALRTAVTPASTVAIGADALRNATTSDSSIAVGTSAGIRAANATRCTFVGHNIAQFGSGNTANITDAVCVGFNAGNSLQGSSDGSTTTTGNVLVGRSAGSNLTSGNTNTFVGNTAGTAFSATDNNVCIGASANVTGGVSSGVHVSNATLVGAGANVAAATGPVTNVSAFGFGAQVPANTSNFVRIGNASVTTIQGQVAFTNVSDIRDKDEIREIDEEQALQAVLAAKPVHYVLKDRHRDKEEDHIVSVGFIAQQLEEVEEVLGAQDLCLVNTANKEQYSMAETHMIPLLVKAVQRLAKLLDVQPTINVPLRTRSGYGYSENQPWQPPQIPTTNQESQT